MSAIAMPRPKRADGEKRKRNTAPVQVEAELAHMAAVIAAHDQKNIAEMLSPLIRQWLITNYDRVQQEIKARSDRMKAESESP